jgi:hypothetical protein
VGSAPMIETPPDVVNAIPGGRNRRGHDLKQT